MLSKPAHADGGKKVTGLVTKQVPDKHLKQFLDLARSTPKDEQALKDVLSRLDRQLTADGVHGEILHVDLGEEFVPVWRYALHSWRQVATRATNRVIIKSLPVHTGNLLITSDTGPRLHAFRFAWVSG